MMTWRGYIGLICPSMAVTTEDDFNRNMPEGVGVCSMHIYFEPIGPTPENLREMVKGLEGGCKIFDEPRAAGRDYLWLYIRQHDQRLYLRQGVHQADRG